MLWRWRPGGRGPTCGVSGVTDVCRRIEDGERERLVVFEASGCVFAMEQCPQVESEIGKLVERTNAY